MDNSIVKGVREIMEPMSSSLISQLVLITFLTIINGLFSGIEIAYVALNRQRIQTLADKKNKNAKRVLHILKNTEDFFAVCQIAITLAGFFASAAAATTLTAYLLYYIPGLPGGESGATVIITMILAYITLVVGELYPKNLALQFPERTALWTASLVTILLWVLKPFIITLSVSVRLLEKITPVEFNQDTQALTRSEMQALFATSAQTGMIDSEELTMLAGVLSLDEIIAREVMIPRTDTQMMNIDAPYDENLKLLLNSTYSRIPVYKENRDNVIGIIHMKSLIRAASENGFHSLDFKELTLPPVFVPSTIYIDDLLLEFRKQQQHMAILKDEYGGVEGIVTMEDLLEEIVGEIEDETDLTPRSLYRQVDQTTWRINGLMTMEKFNELFDQEVLNENVETMAGIVIQEIGYVPGDYERVSIRFTDYVLTTVDVENGRIRNFHVVYDPQRKIETDYMHEENQTELEKSPEESD